MFKVGDKVIVEIYYRAGDLAYSGIGTIKSIDRTGGIEIHESACVLRTGKGFKDKIFPLSKLDKLLK